VLWLNTNNTDYRSKPNLNYQLGQFIYMTVLPEAEDQRKQATVATVSQA